MECDRGQEETGVGRKQWVRSLEEPAGRVLQAGLTVSTHELVTQNRRRKEVLGMSPTCLTSSAGRILLFNQNNGLEGDQGKDGAHWAKIICLGHTKFKVSLEHSVMICRVAFVCA